MTSITPTGTGGVILKEDEHHSPIRRLPAEVMAKILYYARTRASKLNLDQQTIQLSSVCRFWRQVINELCYSMWTTIIVAPRRIEFARLCLERSGNRKIRVIVHGEKFLRRAEDIRQVIPHASRIYFLRYSWTAAHRSDLLIGPTYTNLVTLHLVQTESSTALGIIHHAPQLVDCVLTDNYISYNSTPYAEIITCPYLRRMEMLGATNSVYEDAEECYFEVMNHLITPALKSLTFHIRDAWYTSDTLHTLFSSFESFLTRSDCQLEKLDIDLSIFNATTCAPLTHPSIRSSLKALHLRTIEIDPVLANFLTFRSRENESLPMLERLEIWNPDLVVGDFEGRTLFTDMVQSRREGAEYVHEGELCRAAMFTRLGWHGIVPHPLNKDFDELHELAKETTSTEVPFIFQHIERWG